MFALPCLCWLALFYADLYAKLHLAWIHCISIAKESSGEERSTETPADSDGFEHIEVKCEDGLKTITFNRPAKYNALNHKVCRKCSVCKLWLKLSICLTCMKLFCLIVCHCDVNLMSSKMETSYKFCIFLGHMISC